MERDFLGLNLKEQLVVVKEEIIEGTKDPGFAKGSGVQWPFMNKAPGIPHFMSFKAAQEDKPKKADPILSSGFMPVSTADACQTGEIQKTFNQSRQGGTHFSVTAYPVQPEAHTVYRPHDVKMFPVSNISLSMSNPSFRTHFATTGQNLAGPTLKQQFVGGIPVTAAHATLPSAGSVAGFTDLWNNNGATGSPAQLTVFYGGTVNVYDDISPEKAQAIMFLAGNGSSTTCHAAHQRPQVQASSSKLAASNGVMVNQPMTTPPSSGLSSPLSVSSHTGSQSGTGSSGTDEPMAAKCTGVTVAPVTRLDPPKIVSSLGTVTAATMVPCAVPQFRKASLARFLEKRKERVMNAAPYNPSKKSSECATPDSNGVNVNVCATSGMGL